MCLTHRYYDPGAGKFINRDPIGYEGGANLYGFCGGNPVNESDPSGLAPTVSLSGVTASPIDYAKVGRTVSRYLRYLPSMKELVDAAAQSDTPITPTPLAPGTSDSPDARAMQEIERETERTQRPLTLPGVRGYNAPRVPGYDQHHLDPPYGPHPPGYRTGPTIDVLNQNMPRRIPNGINMHTGPGDHQQSLDKHIQELGYSRRAYIALPHAKRQLLLRRYYSSQGIPYE